jgi:His-Xaa-Ser system protein HxsD
MSGAGTPDVSSVETEFSAEAFSLETVKKSAYRMLDRFSTDIRAEGTDIRCRLDFRTPVSQEQARKAVMDFRDEVLDQDLRHIVTEETTPMRNAILAYAFSRTGLQRE